MLWLWQATTGGGSGGDNSKLIWIGLVYLGVWAWVRRVCEGDEQLAFYLFSLFIYIKFVELPFCSYYVWLDSNLSIN